MPTALGSARAGAVGRLSARIAFSNAALNWMQVFAAYIRNAYIQAPSSEKHCIACGAEFVQENVVK